MSAKVAPKDLPCLFESLANKYDVRLNRVKHGDMQQLVLQQRV